MRYCGPPIGERNAALARWSLPGRGRIRYLACMRNTSAERRWGCARVLTDGLTFGWLADVVIAPEFRGQGLGKFLVQCVLEHPDCVNLKQFLLATRDAHGLYTPFGWKPAPIPQNYLIRFDPNSPPPSQVCS
ncbi:MAG: GNAT family N-acetyltransferase [Candidatus Hydrogenedentes bacterium]|nr:GNAT family N-acetyltransferase [Candidatus Hydrogenedentota bacterium]